MTNPNDAGTMLNPAIAMAAEIDGWLCGVQRCLIHQNTDWHCGWVLAGFYKTPKTFIKPT